MDKGYIYKIVNNINGKMYVGQTNNPDRRKMDHFYALNNNKHFNNYLQNSWNKYGKDCFDFIVIGEYNAEEICKWEEYWIKTLNTRSPNGYNILSGGERMFGENNPFYGKTHSEETRKILSEKHKNIYDGENNPMYGKHHTEEAKEKIKQKNIEKGMYEYHKQRMINNRAWENSSKINPILMINHENKQVLMFYTRARAGRYIKEIGLSNAKYPENIIRRYLKKEDCTKRFVYGYEWVYAKELIQYNFIHKEMSTCGFLNRLINNDEDKIKTLFKPYFYDNKDDIVDLSINYDDIANRILEVKDIYNHFCLDYMSGKYSVEEDVS